LRDVDSGDALLFPSRGIVALLLASVSFGSSAIFIRYATEASAISLTLFRLSIAALGMVLFALSRRTLRLPTKRDLVLVAFSGMVLTLHFVGFIFAVKETTVANATFLVNTSPVMLAVLSPIIIRERTSSREGLAVVVATLGVMLVAYGGNGFRAFGYGDLSALMAALFVALYSLTGRRLRTSGITTACYTSYVYSFAAVLALVLAEGLGGHTFRGYDTTNIIAILGLALIPTMVGHSLYNYSLGLVKIVTANLFPLLEPVIASLFAASFFSEIPSISQVVGYSLILVSVIIVVRAFK